jgi:hypothetical protein
VLGVFVVGLDLRATVSTGNQPEEVVAPVKVSAESVLVEPSPLPPAGIREPLPGRTRAITHGPVPHDLPIPPGAPVFLEPQLPAAAATYPMPMSPAPSSSFLALGDAAPTIQVIPPDTQGAVGTDRLMVAANSQVRIQMRDGSVVSTKALNSFFGSLSGGSGVYDPVVNYDPYSSRWILVACDDPVLTTSALLISASDSTDPDGNFRVWRFTADSTGVLWADRPHVGFNKDWLVIQINMYKVSDSTYAGSNIYACPKTTLYAGGNMSCSLWKTTTIGASQVPVRTLDPSVGAVYLVQTYNNDNAGTAYLGLYSITGSGCPEPPCLTTIGYPSTTATWSYNSSSDLGPQSGSSNHIDLGDHRMLDAVYRNGSIWASHTIFLPTGGTPTRTAAQWWQLSTGGSILQRGRIDDASGVTSFAYPSLAVNKDNAVLLGFSSFSANTFAGAAYAFRKSSDPTNSMQSTVLLKGGEAPYYKMFGGTKNRWGDYSATVVDPVNDTDMWTIQEYAAAPGTSTYPDRWSTWWGRVVPSSGGGSTGGPCTPDSQTLCLNNNRFKVQAAYRDYNGKTGMGSVQKLTDLAGYFYFFDVSNPEVLAKFVSFCSGSSGNWAIYASGLTDVQVTFMVTDTTTSLYKEYTNALGNKFCTIGDGPFTCP